MYDVYFTEIIQNTNRSQISAFWSFGFLSLIFFKFFFSVGRKYPIPLDAKKMFSTQKYPAVNFVLRKNLRHNGINRRTTTNKCTHIKSTKNIAYKGWLNTNIFVQYMRFLCRSHYLSLHDIKILSLKCSPLRLTAEETAQNEEKKINQFSLEQKKKKSIQFHFWQFLNELYAFYKLKFIGIFVELLTEQFSW